MQTYTAEIKNLEVRKIEELEYKINDKTYKSLNIHFDNEDCDRIVIKDGNYGNKEKYKRGMIGTAIIRISSDNKIAKAKNGTDYVTEKMTVQLQDFIEDK